VTLTVGQTLSGHFRVEVPSETSAGAAVALASDVRSGAGVRLVVIPLAEPPRETGVERLLSEQDRYRIGQSSIARPLQVALEASQLVFAYERGGAETLVELVARRPTSARVAAIVRSLGRALAPLHEQGIAFGHLRPELVALSGDSDVSLVGFGIQGVLRAVAGERAVVDALPAAYRAPELANGAPLSPSAEVYAFGVIVTELLLGRRLGDGDSLVSPRASGGDVSDEVEALVRRALGRAAQRPTNIQRFADELAQEIEIPFVPLPSARAPEGGPAVEPPPPAPPELETPWSKPEEPPQAPPATVTAPRAPPPPPREPPPFAEPPASMRPPRTSWVAVSTLVGGVLLMLLAVGGIFAYGQYRGRATLASPSVAVVLDAGMLGAAGASGVSDAGVDEPEAGIEPEDDAGSRGWGTTPGDDAGADEATDAEAPLSSLVEDAGSGSEPTAADDEGILAIGRQTPVLGSSSAPVSVVVFGDFECPFTRRSVKVLQALTRAFPSDVRVAWKHRPLASHSGARDAARVAAGLRIDAGNRAFWSFVEQVAGAGTEPASRSRLEDWVKAAGGDPSSVAVWLTRSDTEADVSRDLAEAGLFDVRETPTFFVNGTRVQGFQELTELRDVVQKELAQSRGLAALGTKGEDLYRARVRKNMIGLGADVPVRTCPSVEGSPTRGSNEALVTIVEFSDFECPFCKAVQPTLNVMTARFGGDLRLVWKNQPLSFHARAKPAANFALEARAQGGDSKFWRVHDLLFAKQQDLGDDQLASIAALAGLDTPRMMDAVRLSKHQAQIDEDARLGAKLGIRGVPTFFVNGRRLSGAIPLNRFSAVVQEEIESARRLVSGGTPRSRVYQTLCGQ